MSNYRSKGPVPDRWMNCPRKSLDFLCDKFLAFKTPLSTHFNDRVPPQCMFTPKMVIDSVQKNKRAKLGLWVDLTKTSRFYDKEEIENAGIRYVKVQCEGHKCAPNKQQTSVFVQLCRKFLSINPLEKIAVHCTHGFNRTGFMLVSYLVEEFNFDVSAAIHAFAMIRPPGIYKQDYLHELFERYDDIPCNIPAPPLPDWCSEEEPPEVPNLSSHSNSNNYSDTESGRNSNQNYSDSSSGSNGHHSNDRHRNNPCKLVRNPVFMSGVPGVKALHDEDKIRQLQAEVRKLCNYEKSGFPGSQPVSMSRENIVRLAQKKYMVSWKADGTRYMMYIKTPAEIYFTDRDFSMFKISSLTFPLRKDPNKRLCDTLVDGEMVIDKVNGQSIPRYLVYDIISLNGHDVTKRSFDVRMKMIKIDVIDPRLKAMENNRINRRAEPFSVRAKDFWGADKAGYLLSDKFRLCHEPDGLIFQPVEDHYIMGKAVDVLKWKPHTLNSVDFLMKIEVQTGLGILATKVGKLFVGSNKQEQQFAEMKITKATRDLDNKIVECKWENNQWIFMRERTDKSFPNAYETAVAVCESIKNPVTKEYLLGFIAHELYNRSLMPPPNKRSRLSI